MGQLGIVRTIVWHSQLKGTHSTRATAAAVGRFWSHNYTSFPAVVPVGQICSLCPKSKANFNSRAGTALQLFGCYQKVTSSLFVADFMGLLKKFSLVQIWWQSKELLHSIVCVSRRHRKLNVFQKKAKATREPDRPSSLQFIFSPSLQK
ncbi:hypothetical protein CEXT_583241 [Caerostris extrusa]|uniref:Uncharacterized protein n=1 Tax=Caerostris extrusa TaxID=172846 RepID=A0AAV4QXD8_CAEEX|nr:hypothetical protein CEXT_583241 [Caerostris extrusa]